jgi:hypothetical protein
MIKRAWLAAILVSVTSPVGVRVGPEPVHAAQTAQPASADAGVRQLLASLEKTFGGSSPDGYLELLTANADRTRAEEFLSLEFRPGPSRVVIQERDRQHLIGTLPGTGFRIVVDAFIEHGWRGRIATWQLDIKTAGDGGWRIADQDRLSSVVNLYRLSLNSREAFEARNLKVQAEDLDLTLVEGSVFKVEAGEAVAGLIFFGKGEMRFRPTPDAEKGQVKIFSGSETLESRFDAAYMLMGTTGSHVDLSTLVPRAVDAREVKRAEQLFREESAKSFTVDLADLTRETWWLLPGADDFLAEVRTRSYDTLTYTRSSAEVEDISLFDRRHKRNIAVYSSKDKLAAHGPFYNEDDFMPYDVLDYEIDVTSIPDRQWIDGRTRMRIRVRTAGLGQLAVRLADSLVVRSVYSEQLGRLYNLRVNNQNVVLISLPGVLARDTQISLTIAYSGRLDAQTEDREALALGQGVQREVTPLSTVPEALLTRIEASYLYSNRSHWYPQSTVSDFATGTLQITVPAAYGCIASGVVSSDSPRLVKADDAPTARKVYEFTAERPLRYFSFLVTRLARADRWTVKFDEERDGAARGAKTFTGASGYPKLDLIVDANPREVSNGKSMAERAVDVMKFYESIIGDSPYSSLTLALIEHATPGGHSPGHFAALYQPPLGSPLVWRNDPAFFSKYPEFFLAHELAHQWWGQAVGWRNYHEQWLSEGFAQYFAAMYAQHFRGQEVFDSVMRQIRKSAVDQSAQGPVYLGYRIGHIRSNGHAFRAIVYNKGAAVLHMLRRLLGDDAFNRGIRRFYAESRYRKVGSDDLRQAMEAESGTSLKRFFDRWIYAAALPRLTFSSRVESSSAGQELVLRFEQIGELFDVPVTVVIQYTDRESATIVVPVQERSVEKRVRLAGPLRGVEISKDDGTLAEVSRAPQS